MKITGLDSRQYSWKITRYNQQREECSSLHLRARELLYKLFPLDKIYEELVLPGVNTEINIRPLMADFYIHSKRLMIEVQGEQHYIFNPFFYNNKMEFFRAKRLDDLKKEWCQINKIQLVELPYNKIEKWEEIICQHIC